MTTPVKQSHLDAGLLKISNAALSAGLRESNEK
jgi:hypothetical protein